MNEILYLFSNFDDVIPNTSYHFTKKSIYAIRVFELIIDYEFTVYFSIMFGRHSLSIHSNQIITTFELRNSIYRQVDILYNA